MDKKIKEYFDNFEVPYQPEHWAMMQQRIEIEELAEYTRHEDENFDSAVRAELASKQVPYNQAHWQLMEEKLEADSWRGRMIRYKVLEAAVLLLLLWTSVTLVDFNTTDGSKNQATFNNPLPVESFEIASTPVQTNVFAGSIQISPETKAHKYNFSVIELLPLRKFSVLALSSPDQIQKLDITPLAQKATSILLADNSKPGFSPALAVNPYLSTNGLKLNETKSPFRIGVFGSTAIDQSLAESEAETNKENQHGISVGGGLSLSWRMKQFEIETGAAYNSTIFINPGNSLTQNLDLKTLSTESLESEKFLRLPISVKYLFENDGTWKFYAVGGGNIHLPLNSTTSSIVPETGAATSSALSSLTNDGAKFAGSSTLKNSLSNDGSLLNRIYYTAAVGVGIEKHLSNRTSVYVQPEYYHQLFKPTIETDKGIANTFAVSVGIKTLL